ncbi:MAG: VOC family protein [Methylobacteriaceae bacterium]|nr:VOC family protein [Methylobacteriaceae bacterium]
MALKRRISIVTLGVQDVARSAAFYERIGWRRSRVASSAQIAFLALDNIVLALYPRDLLAEDAGLPLGSEAKSFGGITLAQNLGGEAEVDEALAEVEKAGARVLKPAGKTFWGGYSGYFADPDGHPWEVAFNPHFPLATDGSIALPA